MVGPPLPYGLILPWHSFVRSTMFTSYIEYISCCYIPVPFSEWLDSLLRPLLTLVFWFLFILTYMTYIVTFFGVVLFCYTLVNKKNGSWHSEGEESPLRPGHVKQGSVRVGWDEVREGFVREGVQNDLWRYKNLLWWRDRFHWQWPHPQNGYGTVGNETGQ